MQDQIYNEQSSANSNFITDEMKDKYLTFILGPETYGIEIYYVIEIIGIQQITKVPRLPPYIRGIINLRGNVIPILDVRQRFNIELRDYDERTCIIVVRLNKLLVGLAVDEVSEVADIPENMIAPPPLETAGASRGFIKGIGRTEDSVKILIDAENILEDNHIKLIEKL